MSIRRYRLCLLLVRADWCRALFVLNLVKKLALVPGRRQYERGPSVTLPHLRASEQGYTDEATQLQMIGIEQLNVEAIGMAAVRVIDRTARPMVRALECQVLQNDLSEQQR